MNNYEGGYYGDELGDEGYGFEGPQREPQQSGMSRGVKAAIVVGSLIVLAIIVTVILYATGVFGKKNANATKTTTTLTKTWAEQSTFLTGPLSEKSKIRLSTWIGQTSNGFNGYATICNPCESHYGAFGGISRSQTANGIFEVVHTGIDTIALKCSDGTYLGESTKENIAGTYNKFVINQGYSTTGTKTNLKVSKKGDQYLFNFVNSGKYFAVCNGCTGQITAAGMDPWNNLFMSDNERLWNVTLA